MLFQFRLPTLGFIVGTRAAIAFGAGLLAAERIPESRRRPLALALIGLLATRETKDTDLRH